PTGGSMRGRIESGQPVTLAPADPGDVRVGDVVLVAWKGGYLLHLVKEVEGGRLLIGNNLGKVNGWVDATALRGKVVAVGEGSPGKQLDPDPQATAPVRRPGGRVIPTRYKKRLPRGLSYPVGAEALTVALAAAARGVVHAGVLGAGVGVAQRT